MCRNWRSERACKFGDACHFAHGRVAAEAREGTPNFRARQGMALPLPVSSSSTPLTRPSDFLGEYWGMATVQETSLAQSRIGTFQSDNPFRTRYDCHGVRLPPPTSSSFPPPAGTTPLRSALHKPPPVSSYSTPPRDQPSNQGLQRRVAFPCSCNLIKTCTCIEWPTPPPKPPTVSWEPLADDEEEA